MSLKKCKIKDLGHIYTGNTPPTSERKYYGDKYPLIKPTDMTVDGRYIGKTEESLSEEGYNLFKGKLVPENTPCIVTIGTIGKLCLTKEPSFCNQAVNSIVVNRELYDPLYVFYLMKISNPKVKFLSSGTASGRENVSKTAFENIEVEVFPLPTQHKIAAILSAYDDLIENNTRRIKILEEMAQALYREWFMKFRFPGHEKVKMVESELGMVPEGWEVKKLGDVVELAYGKALKADDRVEGSFLVYGSGGVVGYHNECLVKGPGIIVGRKGNVGSVFWSDYDFFPIDTVYYVKSTIPLPYIYYNLQSQNFINNDAAVPGLNRNQAYMLPFLLPKEEVLFKFEIFVKNVFKHTKNLRNKNANLRRTRDLLLPKLISGEVDVEKIDVQINNSGGT
ncbi:MAG: restriction endonuclease subunit S [Candidatus Methanoperedens sp.]